MTKTKTKTKTITGSLRADTAAVKFTNTRGAVFKLGGKNHTVPGDMIAFTVKDSTTPGLQLRFRRDPDDRTIGARTYSYRGRVRGEKNPGTFQIGDGSMPLAKARERATEIRAACQNGINPNAQRQKRISAEKAAAAARQTFNAVADIYFAKWEQGALPEQKARPRPRSVDSNSLDMIRAARVIGDVAVSEITTYHANHLKMSAAEMSADGGQPLASESVKRAFNFAARVMDFAIANGIADANAFRAVRAPVGSAERERYLSAEELANVWEAACRLNRPFDQVLRFLVAMPLRRSIALRLRWADIDLDSMVLRVRPEIEGNKSAFEWKLPINEIASEVLGKPAHPNDPVFIGHHGGIVSLTTSKKILDRESGVTDWQLHDLRRTVSTLTADTLESADEDALDLWLMHKRKGIKSRYQKAPRVLAMRQAANDWNRVLGQIIGRETSHVIQIGGAA